MTLPLLATKLHIPPLRPDRVKRPRLIEQLNLGLNGSLTLVSAPAGFGKTTLLSEWAAQCDRPVGWVSLDKGDNDPARFWSYVIAACRTIQPDVGTTALAMLDAPRAHPSQAEMLLTELINDLIDRSAASVIVLDDYHLVETAAIHEALTFLFDHLPADSAGPHLVLAGRADPPLPLARLRGRGQLTELRAADLTFTPDEAASFLNDVMDLGLTNEDIEALEERTEGWIVGLQMAALSLKGRQDLSSFIRSFAGSNRFILDYLVDEVLSRQEQSVQQFLLQTSILDCLTGPLCDAVTGRTDSQAVLASLEQANVFIVPLDDERRWYRYHHLFSDLLRSRLVQNQSDHIQVLHRRASEWYAQGDHITEAVSHALLAGDVERVAQLAEDNVLAMMDHGELSRLAGWLDTLPEAIMNARPWLCVAHAWVLVYTGQLGAVEPCLQNAEAALHEAVSQDQRIAGNLAAIRAYAAILQGDNQHAEELARAALKHLTENDLLARGFATRVLGLVHRATGRLEAAAQFYIEASRISRAAGNNHLTLTVLFDLGYLQFLQGRLHQAFDTCQEALKLAEEHQPRGAGQLPVTGYIYALLGRVLCEWNDLDTAVDYARRGAELSEQWGVAEIMVDCYLHFAIVLQSIGDRLGALSAIQKMRESAQRLSEWYITAAEPYEARLHLVLGNVEEAFRWAESQRDGFADNVELDVYTEFAAMTLARVHIVQGRWREALRLLERVLRLTEQMQADDLVIEILILQALALQKADKLDAALDRLTHALSLAEPAGYVRLFIDEGAPMGDLLRRAAARGHHVDYVSRLLSALQVDQDRRAARLQPLSRLQPLIEPLTDRELEVLRLLALGLSNQEIADTLVIALQTAKKHLKNIYSKLEVHSRVEAVSRARELGFL